MNKQDIIHTKWNITQAEKNECKLVICENLNSAGDYYIMWNKSCIETQMSYDLTQSWNQKIDELIEQKI